MTPDEFRSFRNLLGMSQRECGDVLHCSEQAVRKWEAGERAIPRLVARVLTMLAEGQISRGQLMQRPPAPEKS